VLGAIELVDLLLELLTVESHFRTGLDALRDQQPTALTPK
jgi:hypothetical protein